MLARHRILIVDDDRTVRDSCERIFAERGYDVETAATGEEGIERARRGYFDCALLDLKMPDIDGMEIVRGAREKRGHMAVLIITGYGSTDTAAEATRLGVSDYVCKPFTPEEITRAVERALRATPGRAPAPGVERLLEDIRDSRPKPEHYEHRTPKDVARMVTDTIGVKKATGTVLNTLILGALAGAYIGFGAALATLVGSDAAAKVGVGISQVLAGSVFSVGLILVVIAGAELFTGNNLMIAGVLGKKYGPSRMLGRWGLVFAANFAGALLLAGMMYFSGLWKMGSGTVGAKAIAIANAKVHLPFVEALFRGIGCNWLVCLAVWMALAAKDIAGKVLAIFFPIMAFVALGYEHVVANMYFVPMGIFLKGTGVAAGIDTASLGWGRFMTANVIPVTIGNVIGGAIFVGTSYWWVYARAREKQAPAAAQRP